MKQLFYLIIISLFALSGCGADSAPSEEAGPRQPGQNAATEVLEPAKDDSLLAAGIDSTKSPFDKGYFDYQGNINGGIGINMSLYPKDGCLVGSYFYDSQDIEIELEGQAGDKKIVLYEYDHSGKNTGIFQGTLDSVDKIQGTWSSPDAGKIYPFELALKDSLPGAEYGKRYAVSGVAHNDQEVEAFASLIRNAIIKGEKEQLAERILFPINVSINGTETKVDKLTFLRDYDQITHTEFRQAITDSFNKFMFANQQGIMLGNGAYNVWFNEVVTGSNGTGFTIIAINN